jgi:thiamine pyrophosphate-dependent acetolactate synthase large subunit-like protein
MLFQDAMAAGLTDHGIDTVFGLIGDGNLFVMDSFARRGGTTYVDVAHEATAVEAASGYAQVTGRLGVATVTHGPALTNTVTALADAVRARVPLLLLAGDTRPDDNHHLQKIAQREVVLAAGAGFEQLRAPQTLAEDVATAVRRAHAERRPVVLNMPVNFQWAETDYVPSPSRLVPRTGTRPSDHALDSALGIIASAKRPVVLAGRGAIAPTARKALLRLAARIGAPLTTTLKARDLFRGEPHDLGICGSLAHDVALSTLTAADCVIAFGASLNRFTTSEGWLVDGRRLVQVDDDVESLGRYVPPDAGVVSDAATAAEEFVVQLEEAGIPSSAFATDELAARLAERGGPEPDRSTEHTVDIRTAVHRVEAAVSPDRTVVTDSGRFIHAAWPVIGVEEPRHFVHTASFGSIGLGFGTAIGASFGRPDHPTLLVTGDGGFMNGGLNEFHSAVRHQLDLVVIVLNDGAYGAEHIQFVRREMDPRMSTFAWPDLGPVAEALGGRGFTVRNLPELDSALAHLPRRDRPVLIDVHLDPELVPAAH